MHQSTLHVLQGGPARHAPFHEDACMLKLSQQHGEAWSCGVRAALCRVLAPLRRSVRVMKTSFWLCAASVDTVKAVNWPRGSVLAFTKPTTARCLAPQQATHYINRDLPGSVRAPSRQLLPIHKTRLDQERSSRASSRAGFSLATRQGHM